MRRVRLISLCFLLTAFSARATAQWQVTADAGLAHLRQSDVPESNAATLGAGVQALGDAAWFRSSLLMARTGSDRWTTQGVAVASLLSREQHRARFELSGSVSGFKETNASTTTSGEVMTRLHVGQPTFGGAFGLGAGRVNVVEGGGALYHAQGDAWRLVGDDRVIGTVSFVNTAASIGGALPERVSYTDISATWRRDRGPISVGATAGLRAGHSAGWGSADAMLWFLPNAGVVAAVGRSLEDVTRGIPRTQFASVAIRLAVQPQTSLRSACGAGSRPHGGCESRVSGSTHEWRVDRRGDGRLHWLGARVADSRRQRVANCASVVVGRAPDGAAHRWW